MKNTENFTQIYGLDREDNFTFHEGRPVANSFFERKKKQIIGEVELAQAQIGIYSARPNPRRREKNKLNFYFHTSSIFISIHFLEMHGMGRVEIVYNSILTNLES